MNTKSITLSFPIDEYLMVQKISNEMGWTITEAAEKDAEAFLQDFRCAVQSAKDFKEGKTQFMTMNELLDEL